MTELEGTLTVLRVDFLSPPHGQSDHLGLHIEPVRALEPPQHLADTPELQGHPDHPLSLRLVEHGPTEGAGDSIQDLIIQSRWWRYLEGADVELHC